MRLIRTCYCISVLFIATLFIQCKKSDFANTASLYVNSIVTKKFLTLPAGSDPLLERIVADLSKKEKNNPFINKIVTGFGFPAWNKPVFCKGNSNANSRSSASDSVALIALIGENENTVKAVLVISITDSLKYRLFNPADYRNAGFQDIPGQPSANKFLSVIMYMDNYISGREHFWLADGRLFKPSPHSADSLHHQPIIFKRHSGNSTRTGETGFVDICYDVIAPCNGWVTGCPPGDPCNPYCTTSYCETFMVWFSNYQDEYIDPIDGGGGSGGNNGTGGGGSGNVILYPLISPKSITDNLTTPCLVTAKQLLTNVVLVNQFTQLYWSSFSKEFNIVFKENPNLVDNDGITPKLAESNIVGMPGFERTWEIVINPKFFNGTLLPHSSQQYAAQTILHEIIHGFIAIYEEDGASLGTFDSHKVIFKNWIDNMSGALVAAFPGLSLHDANALALSGIDDVLKIEYAQTGQAFTYDEEINQMATQSYGISIPDAIQTSGSYFLGEKGTLCP